VTLVTEPIAAGARVRALWEAFFEERVMKKVLVDTLIALVLAAGSW